MFVERHLIIVESLGRIWDMFSLDRVNVQSVSPGLSRVCDIPSR